MTPEHEFFCHGFVLCQLHRYTLDINILVCGQSHTDKTGVVIEALH